jgi:hypothetical protein
MRKITARCALAVTLAAAAAAQHAVAAEATTVTAYTSEAYGPVVEIVGEPNEANVVRVSLEEDWFVITDDRAITSRAIGCWRIGANSVACPPGRIWVNLGDLNDSFAPVGTGSSEIIVDGGPGADRLEGSIGDDTLRGNGGDDTLLGAFGADKLYGGDGVDVLDGGPGGDGPVEFNTDNGDLLSGGSGQDKANFSTHSTGVAVALDDQANDGAWGEQDNVRTDVENLNGSEHGDWLQGSASANRMWGRGGWDRMYGLAGNDTLNARDAASDGMVDCGAGTDVATIDPGDPAAACESVS